MEILDISTIRDTRTGKYAKQPKVSNVCVCVCVAEGEWSRHLLLSMTSSSEQKSDAEVWLSQKDVRVLPLSADGAKVTEH